MNMMLDAGPAAVAPAKARKRQDRSVRDGDAVFYAWGDARRAGYIEAMLSAGAMALSESGGVSRAPGTHSNPVLSRLLNGEQLQLGIALAIDNEINQWRKKSTMRLWARIADAIYAAPGHVTNADAAALLGVSIPTVERCRTSMRRIILITARMAGYGRA